MNTPNYQPTRKAVLIGCPGGDRNDFLSGVQQDLKNVSNYLQSERGGSWYPSEIQALYKVSTIAVSNAIRNAGADYVFVYFSGHGYTEFPSQTRILCLQDGNVPDTILFNRSLKQLMIIDACRTEVRPAISGIPQTYPEYDYFSGSPARELFDTCIKKSPTGKLIVYSTNKGKPSYDTNDGGAFTNALLHVGWGMVTKVEYTPIPIEKLLSNAQKLLRLQDNYQIPTVVYKEGNLTVPFAIGIPQSEIPILPSPPRNPPVLQTEDSNNGLLLLSITVFTLLFFVSRAKK